MSITPAILSRGIKVQDLFAIAGKGEVAASVLDLFMEHVAKALNDRGKKALVMKAFCQDKKNEGEIYGALEGSTKEA